MPKIEVFRIHIGKSDLTNVEHQPDFSECTLDEATRRLPAGVYTTFRTYQKTSVLLLQDHFDRLEESAQLIGVTMKLERETIRIAMRGLVAVFPADELRIRLCIPILDRKFDYLYIMLESLRLPDEKDYRYGVQTKTIAMNRDQPAAKWSGFIEKTSPIRADLSSMVNEILMVDSNGRILEGLSSNFFAIRCGVIYTAEGNVLAGITRKLILDVIADLGLPLVLEGYRIEELQSVEEAFISSTSRGVLPVVQIDDTQIGNGQPGRITRQIVTHFERKVKENLEPI